MTLYRVRWEIDIEAETLFEAAEAALAIQRDPESTATVFHVKTTDPRLPWYLRFATGFEQIDLLEFEGKEGVS